MRKLNGLGLVVWFVMFVFSTAGYADDPNVVGEPTACYPDFGVTETSERACPDWFWVFSRDGFDGGQLTVQLDGCQIIEYEHYAKPQSGGIGVIS